MLKTPNGRVAWYAILKIKTHNFCPLKKQKLAGNPKKNNHDTFVDGVLNLVVMNEELESIYRTGTKKEQRHWE